MNTRTRDTTARRMALALGGALTLASAGPAAAGTVQFTACPYTIPAPGTYVLAADFACGGGITVQADDVQLVLGKHTITGLGISLGGDGVVATSHKGLRVVGGTITGFGRGIDIQAT